MPDLSCESPVQDSSVNLPSESSVRDIDPVSPDLYPGHVSRPSSHQSLVPLQCLPQLQCLLLQHLLRVLLHQLHPVSLGGLVLLSFSFGFFNLE